MLLGDEFTRKLFTAKADLITDKLNVQFSAGSQTSMTNLRLFILKASDPVR